MMTTTHKVPFESKTIRPYMMAPDVVTGALTWFLFYGAQSFHPKNEFVVRTPEETMEHVFIGAASFK
jgi:hypothetical protein